LPELVEAVAAQQLVYIVEGEACVEALRKIGANATSNPGGAGKWLPEMSEWLRGADVVLLPDNDDAGWKHVNKVGGSLVGIAARTRVLVLPNLSPKDDVCDWLAAGGTREQLDALTEKAPDWQPPPPEPSDETEKTKADASDQELIDELARLNARDYDRRRDEAADQMGIRRGTLDNEVEARRREQAEEAGAGAVVWPLGCGAVVGGRRRRRLALHPCRAPAAPCRHQ
jgi:DNA primase